MPVGSVCLLEDALIALGKLQKSTHPSFLLHNTDSCQLVKEQRFDHAEAVPKTVDLVGQSSIQCQACYR